MRLNEPEILTDVLRKNSVRALLLAAPAVFLIPFVAQNRLVAARKMSYIVQVTININAIQRGSVINSLWSVLWNIPRYRALNELILWFLFIYLTVTALDSMRHNFARCRTALMMAAESGHLAVCDYLVRQGADLTITNTRGMHKDRLTVLKFAKLMLDRLIWRLCLPKFYVIVCAGYCIDFIAHGIVQ